MAVLIGGEKAYLKRSINGFIISYQWLNEEPAMFIARDDRFAAGNRPAVVVKMEDSYRYTDNKNNPTKDLFLYAYESANHLGFVGDYAVKEAAKKIITLILDGIQDLIEMPPEPTGMTKKQEQQIGEAKIMVDGQTIFHDELTVPEGMQA